MHCVHCGRRIFRDPAATAHDGQADWIDTLMETA